MYTIDWDPNPGAIIRSSDRGATWASTDLPFKVGGNMPGRGMGERLAVDPNNPDILYFGARSGNGLWRSTDGGVSWEQVTSFPNPGTYVPDPSDAGGYNGDVVGLAFVTFDSTSAVVGGATSRIFVGTADNVTASVYVSEDAGATWSAVPGQPRRYFPHKCKLQPDEKALYLTYSDGAGPYDGTAGAVYRYDIAAAAWKDITPVSGDDLYFGFGGLGLDMQNPGTLVVASLNSWWPDAQIFRSTDSGETWSPIWEWTAYPEQNWYYGLYVSRPLFISLSLSLSLSLSALLTRTPADRQRALDQRRLHLAGLQAPGLDDRGPRDQPPRQRPLAVRNRPDPLWRPRPDQVGHGPQRHHLVARRRHRGDGRARPGLGARRLRAARRRRRRLRLHLQEQRRPRHLAADALDESHLDQLYRRR